ncbi:hypothetical protein DFH06DRAFT_1315336 [Mycena polygramma]|nr:hypothetical protein DFH06DRAFT_1315336 [Mycena polygramma]
MVSQAPACFPRVDTYIVASSVARLYTLPIPCVVWSTARRPPHLHFHSLSILSPLFIVTSIRRSHPPCHRRSFLAVLTAVLTAVLAAVLAVAAHRRRSPSTNAPQDAANFKTSRLLEASSPSVARRSLHPSTPLPIQFLLPSSPLPSIVLAALAAVLAVLAAASRRR